MNNPHTQEKPMTQVNFSLIDQSPDIPKFPMYPVKVNQCTGGGGIGIAPQGLVTKTGDDEVIYLEHFEGKWRLHVWADKNQEDPTHIIEFDAAIDDAPGEDG
jgi:hypothetical protein